ncbi:protein of unknown function [Rhizobium sp. NFR07]|nr:protein of unknown function [Rhizobium sp. NFR07]
MPCTPGFFLAEKRRGGLDPARLSSYIGTMQERSPTPRHKIYGGVAASVAVHAVIVAALLISLPVPEPEPPQKEETVSVEMVPPEEAPPETAKEEPAKEEEQALDLTMPEEKPEEQKAEVPPPPEPPQQEAEEQGAPPQPPAEEQAATAQEAEPPPPQQSEQQEQAAEPPPEAEQQAEAEQPPPPPAAEEQPPEQAAEPPQQQMPPPSEQMADAGEQQQAQGQVIPTLRPVFEFGEENAGPEVAQDGDAAEQGQETETPPDAAEADTPTDTTEQANAEADATSEDATAEPSPADDIAAPQIDGTTGEPLASSEDQPDDGAAVAIIPEPRPAPPAPEKPAEDAPKPAGQPPKEVKRLFSQQDTDDPVAMTAMGSIPRDIRASQLCATELREQLRHASPAYQPELLPSYRLPEGTVLDIRQAAFRANGQWFNIGFRCEIDQNATKVVSFGFDVGGAVPRSQWRERGFPEL